MRKTFGLLAILALASAAHAESYDGVHQGPGLLARGDVAAQAVATAHAPDQNVTRGSRVNSVVISTMPPVRSAIGEAPATRF